MPLMSIFNNEANKNKSFLKIAENP